MDFTNIVPRNHCLPTGASKQFETYRRINKDEGLAENIQNLMAPGGYRHCINYPLYRLPVQCIQLHGVAVRHHQAPLLKSFENGHHILCCRGSFALQTEAFFLVGQSPTAPSSTQHHELPRPPPLHPSPAHSALALSALGPVPRGVGAWVLAPFIPLEAFAELPPRFAS